MIRVKEIAFTGYPVTDIPRARGFYEGVLGLTPSTTFGHDGGQWIEYDVGPATIAITNMSADWKPSSDGPAVALEVEDFDGTVRVLRACGARFTVEPMSVPTCRLAVVCDPDGNSVAIHQRNGHAHA